MFQRCIFVAASAFLVSALQSQHMELLQPRVDAVNGNIEDTVPTTEKGYQTIASLKDNEKMKAFIHRVVQNEARHVEDVAELNGMVPFYSGMESVQTLDALKHELRSASWVADGEGRTAALNEIGYQQVASRKSKPHMVAFARRILDASGKKVVDEAGLMGLIPYFDGEISVQSFDALSKELMSAPWASPRMAPPAPAVDATPPAPAVDVTGSKEDLDEESVETTVPEGDEFAREHESKEPDGGDEVKAVFISFDIDGNGRLSATELKQALQRFGRESSDDAVDMMLKGADTDGNGELVLDEWTAKLKD